MKFSVSTHIFCLRAVLAWQCDSVTGWVRPELSREAQKQSSWVARSLGLL